MDTVSRPAAVSVTRWGDLPAERKLPGVILRVLVDGQHAGAIGRDGKTWLRRPSPPRAGQA